MSLRDVEELVDILGQTEVPSDRVALVDDTGDMIDLMEEGRHVALRETLRDLLALDRVARAYGVWGASQVSGEGEGSTREREPGVKDNGPADVASGPVDVADLDAAREERTPCPRCGGRWRHSPTCSRRVSSEAVSKGWKGSDWEASGGGKGYCGECGGRWPYHLATCHELHRAALGGSS